MSRALGSVCFGILHIHLWPSSASDCLWQYIYMLQGGATIFG